MSSGMRWSEEQLQAIQRRQQRATSVIAPSDIHGSAVLAWPPSNNNLYTVARGRKILSEEGRAYRDAAIMQIASQRTVGRMAGHVSVRIIAYPPDRRRRDLDNLLKMPLDCLVKSGVISDDSMIHSLAIEWGAVSERPRIVVRLQSCPGIAAQEVL
jgi:crossover junction endodeoxyribonuclease RusA